MIFGATKPQHIINIHWKFEDFLPSSFQAIKVYNKSIRFKDGVYNTCPTLKCKKYENHTSSRPSVMKFWLRGPNTSGYYSKNFILLDWLEVWFLCSVCFVEHVLLYESQIWQTHTLIVPRQDHPLGGPSLTTNTLRRDSVNSHNIQSLQTKE